MSIDLSVILSILGSLGGWEFVKYLLNRKSNRRIAEASARTAEASAKGADTDAVEKLSKLYEGRIDELHESLSAANSALATANETIANDQKRMGEMNKAIDKLQDRIHDLYDKLWKAEQARNEQADQIIHLTSEVGHLHLWYEHFKAWHCRREKCSDRIPPNPDLEGKAYADPEEQVETPKQITQHSQTKKDDKK